MFGITFEFILTWIVIITFVIALVDTVYFAPKRIRKFHNLIGDKPVDETCNEKASFFRCIIQTLPYSILTLLRILASVFLWQKDWYWKKIEKKRSHIDKALIASHKKELHPMMFIEWCKSFFPVLFLVLFIRSFLYSPYVVPSQSLEPTVLPGDFLVANKFDYGLRWPVSHIKFIQGSEPKVGDIVIFKFPPNPKIDYIKRTIGVPGDTISYINKVLYINGKEAKQKFIGHAWEEDQHGKHETYMDEYEEDLNGVKHLIFRNPKIPAVNFHNIKVPKGHYFMMGDNRDDSADSRYWGFMPEQNIVGKANFIFFSKVPGSFDIRWKRIGQKL